MKRLLRFVLLLVIALAVAPFLPLYIERTMRRSWRVDRVGDVIDWGWKITSLNDYWSHYQSFTREQQPALWLTVNLLLALAYALIVAVGIDQFLKRRKQRGLVQSR